ncbi:unnamed protein product, partial [Vitis vinifera]
MGILKRGRKIMGLTCKFLWLKKNPELIVVCWVLARWYQQNEKKRDKVGMFRIVLDSDNISGLPIEEIIQPKMNADNDNKEQLFDLGLALGYSSQCIGKALNNDSGAGANAGSRVDMTLVATDPLSELVWSPHKGLSLKCAENSTDEKRPSLLWGVGPSNMIHSPPQGISARKTISDEPMGEGNLVTSQATLHVKNEMGETDILTCSPRSNAGIMTVHGSSHEPNAGTRDNNDKMMVAVKVSALDVNQERDQGDNEEKGIYVPVHIPMDVTSEARGKKVSGFSGMELGCMADSLSFKMNETEPDMAQIEPLPMQLKKMISSNPNGGIGDDGSGNQTLGMEVVLTTEVPLVKRCKTPDTPVLNSTSPFRRDEGLALAIEEESNNEMKTPGSTSTPLEKLESAAENDLRTQTGENACGAVSKIMASSSDHDVKIISQQDEGLRPKAKALPVNNSPNKSGMYRHRTKGKGKALSDGDRSGRKSNKEDDSDESVESCNSAALFSTGKKRWGYEQQLITGSKRIRKQINGSPGSTSFVRQDSSFMSWISNMMKGLSKSNQDETPSLALTLARPNHDNYDQKLVTCNKNQDPGCRNIGFQSIFQSLYCPTTKVQESRTLNADNQTGEGSKEFCLANKLCDFNQSTFGNRAGPSTQPKVLSAKFAVSQENYKTSSTIHNFGYKSDLLGSLWVTRFSPKTSSPTCKVDHCNQNTGTREYCTEEPLTIVGAELQNCSGGTEVSFGFKKNNAHNNQNSIYKLNPISPSQRFKSSEAMASLFARRLDALKNIITLNQTDTEARATPTCFFCGIRAQSLGCCMSQCLEKAKSIRMWCFFESQIIPLCNFVNPQISDVPKGIFDAIKRLRLSRGDILKWMNSVFPFSHLNGFFLRLRLGKWEEGLGGTGYYVACISGAQKERPSQSSKNPIAVNIGGVKCLVQSQYISNHDFLEDELMAWWGATTRAGGKIPSEEDLKVKLEERKKFGF